MEGEGGDVQERCHHRHLPRSMHGFPRARQFRSLVRMSEVPKDAMTLAMAEYRLPPWVPRAGGTSNASPSIGKRRLSATLALFHHGSWISLVGSTQMRQATTSTTPSRKTRCPRVSPLYVMGYLPTLKDMQDHQSHGS
jgi:hypothetical protein